MSEFMERHSVSKLIGSPPGYVGYGEEGRLIKEVRSRPYSVVLFDEVEKAHGDVLSILLQILEDGKLTASDGKVADFKNTIIILTGNIGAEELKRNHLGFGGEKGGSADVLGALNRQFRPELINRIDNVIVFERLTAENMEEICAKMLESVSQRARSRGIELTFDESVAKRLCESVSEDGMGARPLRRRITADIEDMLSRRMISGELPQNCRAEVCRVNSAFEVRVLVDN